MTAQNRHINRRASIAQRLGKWMHAGAVGHEETWPLLARQQRG